MGGEWQCTPFSEAVRVNPRVILKRGEVYPFVDMQSLDPSKPTVAPSRLREFTGGGSKFEPYDTLMARITPCLENGKIARYVPDDEHHGPAFGSTEFIVIRGREGVTDNDFAFYLTRWSEFRSFAIAQMSGSSGRQRVPAESLAGFEVPVPPLPQQRAIARILGALDDKIELNRRMNETLEGMAQALFKSWFVDFDPVVVNALKAGNAIPDKFAERAAHYRDNPDALGLPEDILRLFPDRFQESQLGPIPEGWEVKPLGAICHPPQYGYTASAKENPLGPKFLRIKDINKLPWIDWSGVPYCKISEKEKAKYILRPGDLVIARIADPGHGALIEEETDAVFASYLIKFRPMEEAYDRYLQYWLRSEPYWQLVAGRQSGSTRANLNAKALGRFPLVVPSLRIAAMFRRQIGWIRARIVSGVRETNLLSSLRDTLLPKLISGELRVPDVEKILEDVE